jgi:hypothetical protein
VHLLLLTRSLSAGYTDSKMLSSRTAAVRQGPWMLALIVFMEYGQEELTVESSTKTVVCF